MSKFFTHLSFFLCVFCVFPQEVKYEVKNLDINNEYPHFGIMQPAANEIVFTSYLLNKRGRVKVSFEGEGILTLYKGSIGKEGKITNIKEIKIDPAAELGKINSAVLTPDGKYIYVATTYRKKNMPSGNFKITNYHLEVGEFKEGLGFTNFKVLPFCKPRYSYAHPALSNDGQTLYFTSNVRGGKHTTKGGSDIFKVEISGNNTFGAIENLGATVNSYSREMFPSLSVDNTLYFASNRPSGFGGYDIYKCLRNEDGTYGKAQKLPEPLNSKKDDFSLIMFDDSISGYLVSKRDGGKGDHDIYYFIKE